MSTLIAATTVSPAWSQIVVENFGNSETPEWDTGEEPLVWTPGCYLIETVDDMESNVLVDFRVGVIDVHDVREIHNGNFVCASGRASVCAPAMAQKAVLTLPRAGDWAIRIAVRGKFRPDYVVVFFNEDKWSDSMNGNALAEGSGEPLR
ncbi:hypothetical protein ACIQCJ_14720 [Streptomyces sp. NPDC093221]|uniref:hypothetical protein n=1 Tax=Streptomyces sp. NPDC093221 TaxID=3366032 RepID=UPI00380D2EC4